MASLSFPALLAPPVSPVLPSLPVSTSIAVPAGLLLVEEQTMPPAAVPSAAGPAGESSVDGAAMRPDQLLMTRQFVWPYRDATTLAASWRDMARAYGNALLAREQQARNGQLSSAVLLGSQNPRPLQQAGNDGIPPDAWRFTVHAGGPREQRLLVLQEEAGRGRQQRRRARAALRLELLLKDGSVVTLQAEPVADGIVLELCASGPDTLASMRALQPRLEEAVRRAGVRILSWSYRDRMPAGRTHGNLPAADVASTLSLPLFRALAEMALLLPLH